MTGTTKIIFICFGSLSYVFALAGISIVLYAFFAQKDLINTHVLFGMDLYQNAMVILLYCFAFMVVFGWVAVFTGTKLKCDRCGNPILVKDKFGFKGLTFKPLFTLVQGRQICSNCLKD